MAFAASGVLGGIVYGVAPTSGPYFALVAVALTALALLATLAPAMTATRADPVAAIRSD